MPHYMVTCKHSTLIHGACVRAGVLDHLQISRNTNQTRNGKLQQLHTECTSSLRRHSLLLVLLCQLSICTGSILTCCVSLVSGQPETHIQHDCQ